MRREGVRRHDKVGWIGKREREGHQLYFPFDKNQRGIGKSKLITSTSSAVPTRKKDSSASSDDSTLDGISCSRV